MSQDRRLHGKADGMNKPVGGSGIAVQLRKQRRDRGFELYAFIGLLLGLPLCALFQTKTLAVVLIEVRFESGHWCGRAANGF